MDFGAPYYGPLDRAYHSNPPENDRRSESLEAPIFPLNKVGMTVPDIDPSGRYRNIIESVDASMRAGAGSIQIVMMGQGRGGAMGGGPKSYGKEVREAIREIQKAAKTTITGVELPNHILNLSGMTQQGFSEEARQHQLEEVRDAIKFIGDIAGGGNVNVMSWEFTRNIQDAPLNDRERKMFFSKEEPVAQIVNKKSGQVVPIKKDETYYLNYNNKTFEPLKLGEEPQPFDWKSMQMLAEKQGRGLAKESPELFLQQSQYEIQKHRYEGDLAHYMRLVGDAEERIEHIEKIKKEHPELYKRDQEKIEKDRDTLKKEKEGFQEAIGYMKIHIHELEREKEKFMPVKEYAVGKSADSYSEAGIWALQESEKNMLVQQGKGSVSVGPELGWSREFYGSHPKEWIGLIKEARKKMADKLTKSEIEGMPNPYFDSSVTRAQAEELAKKHIKGEFDTSHLGSWLQYFKPELSWDKRLEEFKKWYKEQIEYIAEENKKHDLINSIQIVDSASGQHAHLPPGQGILGQDIFDYVKILKEKGGYKGDVTSEGHEEEQFGQGRILTQAWETLGSHIMLPYIGEGLPRRIQDIRHGQAMTSYGSTGIYQSYVPSNDFTLWSQVPLE